MIATDDFVLIRIGAARTWSRAWLYDSRGGCAGAWYLSGSERELVLATRDLATGPYVVVLDDGRERTALPFAVIH